MQAALLHTLGPKLENADLLFMSAAVSDFRPAQQHVSKQKKSEGTATATLTLAENPDLLAELGAARRARDAASGPVGRKPLLVGFAVETGTDSEIVRYARDKLARKRVDLVVANHATDAFGTEDNRVTLVDANEAEALPVMSKRVLADVLLNRALALLQKPS